MSRELLARAWRAGAGPGDAPFTIDLDSTICKTYGLAKEGARHHSYTGARGYHPLLAAGTGDVLLARLREGRANTPRGAAHFLRETVGRVRYAGARGQLTMRADSGLYTHAVVAVCRRMDVRFSITIRQHARLRNLPGPLLHPPARAASCMVRFHDVQQHRLLEQVLGHQDPLQVMLPLFMVLDAGQGIGIQRCHQVLKTASLLVFGRSPSPDLRQAASILRERHRLGAAPFVADIGGFLTVGRCYRKG